MSYSDKKGENARALEIICITCGARKGEWCKTPKRTKRKNLHSERLKMVRP